MRTPGFSKFLNQPCGESSHELLELGFMVHCMCTYVYIHIYICAYIKYTHTNTYTLQLLVRPPPPPSPSYIISFRALQCVLLGTCLLGAAAWARGRNQCPETTSGDRECCSRRRQEGSSQLGLGFSKQTSTVLLCTVTSPFNP